MRCLVLVLAIFAALPLAAATRYTVSIETTGYALQRPHYNVTVLADGAHRRVEIEQKQTPFTHDVLLSDDGGATWIALNTPLKTWFRGGNGAVVGRAHVYTEWPLISPHPQLEIRDIKVTASDEPSEPMLGYAAQNHVLRTTFAMREGRGAARLDVNFGGTAIVTATDAVDSALAVRIITLTTGMPPVDAQLEAAIANIKGFPLKTAFSATRMFPGGRPQIITTTATVTEIRTVAAPPHAFERPADYVYQEPIIGAPGRQ